MVPMKPNISVEYQETATIVTFTDEKILEEMDIQGLQGSLRSVIEQGDKINLVLDFCNVRFR